MSFDLLEQVTKQQLDSSDIFTQELFSLERSLVKIADTIVPEIFPTNKLSEIDDEENSFETDNKTIVDNITDFSVSENASIDDISLDVFTSNNISNNSYSDSFNLQASNFLSPPYLGNLGANRFTLDTRYITTVVSGNGNIDYGNGYYDWLDLSNMSVNQLTKWNFETYNPGNGSRLFDSLTLKNGHKILFEGIDKIVFSDYEYDLSIDPNDPGFDKQWNLHMMGVQNAWRFTTGSDSVLVGVQDSGLGVFGGKIHPDLRTTIHYSDNLADELYRNVQDQDFGARNSSHGTAVQGIIAAKTDNGIGVAGINWNSDVFNIDLDVDRNAGDLDIVNATQRMINYANSQGQNLVINMSITYGYSRAFEQLVANNQDNALFVVATGNQSNSSIANPSSFANVYNNVIAVGAVESNGVRASYSNYGRGITLTGPTEVLSTGAFRNQGFDYHTKFNGTSAAAPNVAGVASLVWSANPNLSATQIKSILSETAYDLGYQGYDWEYGHGFVNADAAVRRAMALSRRDGLTGASTNSFSTADDFSSYDLATASNYSNSIALEENDNIFTQQALDNTTISFGSNYGDETRIALSDSFSENFDSISYSGLSDNLSENSVFYDTIDV